MTRRGVEVGAAAAGVVVSLYLLAVQMEFVGSPFDPLFGAQSTLHVVKSSFSESLPFPDAAAGVIGYALEALLAVAATRTRTHRRDAVVACGVVAGGMALGGVGLVGIQALVVHHWCTLCLLSGTLSWLVAAIAVPDALAVPRGEDRRRARRRTADIHVPSAGH